jgi:hypothetical protein
MVLFRAGTYCEIWSDDLDMNSDMNSKKLRKSSEILIEKKFRNFRRIAKNGEAKRIRFAEKNLVFAFASLFDSKKQSLSQSIFGRNLKPLKISQKQPK